MLVYSSRNMRLRKRGIESVVQKGHTTSISDHEEESSIHSWIQEKPNESDGSETVEGSSSKSEGYSDSHANGVVRMHEELCQSTAQVQSIDIRPE